MTREGVVTYLRSTEKRLMSYECRAEGFWRECIAAERNALRAAIILLQPVSDAEIESARKWAREYTQEEGEPSCAATIIRALDALAREPGLVAAYDALESDRSNLLCEREELQACVRRVREECATDAKPGSMAEEMNGYRTITVKQVLTALDAKEPA